MWFWSILYGVPIDGLHVHCKTGGLLNNTSEQTKVEYRKKIDNEMENERHNEMSKMKYSPEHHKFNGEDHRKQKRIKLEIK